MADDITMIDVGFTVHIVEENITVHMLAGMGSSPALSTLAEKAAIVATDVAGLEDSEAAGAKKKWTFAALVTFLTGYFLSSETSHADVLVDDDLAPQATAEAGVNNDRWMSPLRVAQAIAAWASAAVLTLAGFQEAEPFLEVSGAVTVDLSGANTLRYLMTADTTFTMPVLPASGKNLSFEMKIDCGGFTVSWAGSPAIAWTTSDNAAPTLTVTAGVINRIPFESDVVGSTWLGDFGGATG